MRPCRLAQRRLPTFRPKATHLRLAFERPLTTTTTTPHLSLPSQRTQIRSLSTATPTMSTTQPTLSSDPLAPPPNAGPLTLSIHTKLLTLQPTHLRILNDSHKHAHHEAMSSLSTPVAERETHLRVEIVSEEFGGKRMAARHRMVYGLCREEMEAEGGVHALQISARTGEEEASRR